MIRLLVAIYNILIQKDDRLKHIEKLLDDMEKKLDHIIDLIESDQSGIAEHVIITAGKPEEQS